MFILMYCFVFIVCCLTMFSFFFFNDTATTEIYTLSLHDALPIFSSTRARSVQSAAAVARFGVRTFACVCMGADRKSTRLNSSHLVISYAVFCLKKKKKQCMRKMIEN